MEKNIAACSWRCVHDALQGWPAIFWKKGENVKKWFTVTIGNYPRTATSLQRPIFSPRRTVHTFLKRGQRLTNNENKTQSKIAKGHAAWYVSGVLFCLVTVLLIYFYCVTYFPSSPKKAVAILHPDLPITGTSRQRLLSSVPKVAVHARHERLLQIHKLYTLLQVSLVRGSSRREALHDVRNN